MRRSAAAGLAFVTSLGRVAGFLSPCLAGWIKDGSGSPGIAPYLRALLLPAGASRTIGARRAAIAM